jgi:hypothetical protein
LTSHRYNPFDQQTAAPGARLSSLRRVPLISAQSTQRVVLLATTVGRSDTGKLAAGEGRCRDAGHDEGRRNHESDDQLTHVSFLHKGLEACCLLCHVCGASPLELPSTNTTHATARVMPTAPWQPAGSYGGASGACLHIRHIWLIGLTTAQGCTEKQAVTGSIAGGHGSLDDRSTSLHGFLGIMPS